MKSLAQNTLIQNRYLIVQLIGKGGMGEVYLAVDQRLGSAVALKRTLHYGDEALDNAFEREARVLARLRHPVLPKVSDHFTEGDQQFLVMEHISGDDLAKRIEIAGKPFPVSWVMFWADQLLDALSYLHSHEPPIIHRDIKPQNLKLTDENHIVLLDFGLSKSSTGQTNLGPTSGGSTGSVVGYTPHYAPMEQIRGIGTSPRSDIYSLSATLYQLLTNTVPVDALTRADDMLNGSPDPVRPIDEVNPEVAREISDVILRGMAVSQEKRFESAREMQKTLRRAYSDVQNAMSAKTVVIPGGTNISDQAGASRTGDAADQLVPVPTNEPEPDFGATLVYEGVPVDAPSEPQQSGIKTEVFIPGAASFIPETSEQPESDVPLSSVEEEIPDFAMTNAYSGAYSGPSGFENSASEDTGTNFEPNATVPIIAFEGAGETSSHRDYDATQGAEGFHTAAAVGETGDQQWAASPSDQAQQYTAAASAPKKKGGAGKIIALLGGLFLLLLLGGGIAGGIWAYFNYVAVDADPTPTPTPFETPSPTPDQDIALPTETPTPDSSPSPSPSPEQSPSPEATSTPVSTDPRPTPVGPRPTPAIPRPTPTTQRPTPAPTRAPTPRPRPTILQ